MPRSRTQSIHRWNGDTLRASRHDLIGEEPLEIRVEGKPYAVVLRTPGEELAHAAGFCLAEGLVDHPEELATMALCDGEGSNVVTVTLSAQRRTLVAGLLERRSYISQTGCGLCGRELVEELAREVQVLPSAPGRFALARMDACLRMLAEHQPLRAATRTAHAAALLDWDLRLLITSEDVGRHNALDKAIGRLFLERRLASAGLAVLSSRISYEMVLKAARAQIGVVLGFSWPTGLAVDLAERLGMALACTDGTRGLVVFCGAERFAEYAPWALRSEQLARSGPQP
jgi:FdhD protein